MIQIKEKEDFFSDSKEVLRQISNDKNVLVNVIGDIRKSFLTAKKIMEEEPEEARYTFEKLLVQLTLLRSITFLSKQDEWLTEIDRLHRLCTEKISLIQMRRRVEKQPLDESTISTASSQSKIPNWKDPLLLQSFQVSLAEIVILPYIFPHLYPVLKNIIILNGPSKSGKTFTMKAIESYLQVETSVKVVWKSITSFQLSSIASVLLTAIQSPDTFDMKIVIVVDRVSTTQWNNWQQEDWFQILIDVFKTNKLWKLIIITEPGSSIDSITHGNLKSMTQLIYFKLPDVKTIYAYIKSLVSVYIDTRVVSVPILLDLQGLVTCAETMTKFFSADFDKVESWVQRAIHLSHELVIEDAVILKIGDHWIPRLSLFSERTHDLPYTVCRGLMLSKNSVTTASLLRPLDTDAIVFDGETYVSEKLLDYLPSIEPDRGMELFVKTNSSRDEADEVDQCSFMPSSSTSDLDVICRFSVTLDRYPDIPVTLTHGIYSYLLAAWISIWKQLYQTSVKSTLKTHKELHSKLAIIGPELQTIFYTRDMNTILDETIELLVNGSVSFPQSLSECTKECSKQVLIISGADENFAFYFSYGQKSSKASLHDSTVSQSGGYRKPTYHQTFTTIGGMNNSIHKGDQLPVYSEGGSGKSPHKSNGLLHGKEKAQEIKEILDELLGQKESCQVFQIKTEHGYEWFIDFFVTLEDALEVKVVKGNSSRATLLPRVQSVMVFDDLVQDYCITNEIDLDILQEKFPSFYSECFRDEEDTWKMTNLKDPSHVVPLNSFYTKEHKFYLNLLFLLQSYKRDHYADLTLQQQPYLDSTLTYIQNLVDFMLMITSENDESGSWEGIWSVSTNHLTYKSDNANVSRGSVDISREWLKSDMTFWISPCIYNLLFDLCEISIGEAEQKVDSEIDPLETVDKAVPFKLKSLFSIWKVAQCDKEILQEIHRFYVKSKLSLQAWKESKTTFHLLPRSEVEISTKLKSKDYVLYYTQRLKESLFHRLFENAQLIGCEESSNSVAINYSRDISWYSFHEDKQNHAIKEIRSTIESIKSFENAWYLLSTGSKSLATSQLLFSLYFASMNNSTSSSTNFTRQLIGNLLYFPILHSSSKRGHEKTLDSIDQRTLLRVLNKKVSFLLRLLNPVNAKKNSPNVTLQEVSKLLVLEREQSHQLHVHTSSLLLKNIFPQEDYDKVKNYSLKTYHLMDQLYCDDSAIPL